MFRTPKVKIKQINDFKFGTNGRTSVFIEKMPAVRAIGENKSCANLSAVYYLDYLAR